MTKFIIFIIGLPLGIAIIMYRKAIIDFTGKMDWAEEKLGPGGTYTVMVGIGFIIWVGCLMYSLGSFDLIFGFLDRFFTG